MQTVNSVSTSFIQDAKHESKSDRFKVITPSNIAQTLSDRGFELVNLKTGSARKTENKDHQRTIARYRSKVDTGLDGINFDIIADIPHLTGAAKFYIGLFRLVCSNGLVTQTNQFQFFKVRHSGNSMLEQLDMGINQLVASQNELITMVQSMQNVVLSPDQINLLAKKITEKRLEHVKNVKTIVYQDLVTPRRAVDQANDLFTVFNVIQENMMRKGFAYTLESTSDSGEVKTRYMTSRRMSDNSINAVDANILMWNEAREFLASAA